MFLRLSRYIGNPNSRTILVQITIKIEQRCTEFECVQFFFSATASLYFIFVFSRKDDTKVFINAKF